MGLNVFTSHKTRSVKFGISELSIITNWLIDVRARWFYRALVRRLRRG